MFWIMCVLLTLLILVIRNVLASGTILEQTTDMWLNVLKGFSQEPRLVAKMG